MKLLVALPLKLVPLLTSEDFAALPAADEITRVRAEIELPSKPRVIAWWRSGCLVHLPHGSTVTRSQALGTPLSHTRGEHPLTPIPQPPRAPHATNRTIRESEPTGPSRVRREPLSRSVPVLRADHVPLAHGGDRWISL